MPTIVAMGITAVELTHPQDTLEIVIVRQPSVLSTFYLGMPLLTLLAVTADGCDFNPFRQGNETFYGSGMAVDTDSVITVVTQFVEESGSLSAIKRFYVQNGVVIANSESEVEGVAGYNNITDEYCTSQKTAFGDEDVFSSVGGLAQMGDAMTSPMVLVMSVWDDVSIHVLIICSFYKGDDIQV